MKKYILATLIAVAFTACSQFTEIDPKGKNILKRVEDLDLVLNNRCDASIDQVLIFMNDYYPIGSNTISILNETIKSLQYSYLAWDSKVDRVGLTASDLLYSNLYGIIGQIANPVLLNIDEATGNRGLANQLKAEALVIRGWHHYLLVNLYAKAYDPATAAQDPGIVYSKETDDLAIPNEKLAVARIYELILEDLNAALDLGSLPNVAKKMRVGLPFAYAAKAKVLMSMRDYNGAFAAATESLKLQGTIDDYNDLLAESVYYGPGLELTRPVFSCKEELFEQPYPFSLQPCIPELMAAFEDTDVRKKYWITDESLYGIPLFGSQMFGVDIPVIMSSVYYSPTSLTTVDMYLAQAECYIRESKTGEAMNILNQIRERRLERGTYSPETASTPQEAFEWLKRISRTENFATIKNYLDHKRWNTEKEYEEILTKNLNGQTYTLEPDSPLWIFPFPQNATVYNTNLTQNY